MMTAPIGDVAQLVERLGRIEEARGSIPLISTAFSEWYARVIDLFSDQVGGGCPLHRAPAEVGDER